MFINIFYKINIIKINKYGILIAITIIRFQSKLVYRDIHVGENERSIKSYNRSRRFDSSCCSPSGGWEVPGDEDRRMPWNNQLQPWNNENDFTGFPESSLSIAAQGKDVREIISLPGKDSKNRSHIKFFPWYFRNVIPAYWSQLIL